MSVFKCKMCGGTIEFNQGDTVGVCDSCGTKQTLPRLDDDKKANLYDRANHFRRNNEFDKAMAIYEQILNEDGTDAEAYWSIVLCRYGIEYVEDPTTHKRVPTVNRAQFTSIFDDDNYKSALQYADDYQKAIYEEEASTINEIQKGILAISQKEEPFDVFICYKETDNSGRRTQDSVLANDLYHQLTAEGFKVFFAAITLEDKLGTAYEPYIFAALNSSKVMVVLGTKPEYFNAVWVKNEWSRYLALVKNSNGQKMLIPAYRDMDPYDLPEEFSHLQAQDMSKLGFMQDLIRGIKKIIEADAPKQTVKETAIVGANNAATAPLLERVFLFLEDGKWQDANIYCEKVLDIDPKNAEAYLGKLMAEMKVYKKEDLKNCAQPFDENNNYQKAVRFGDAELPQYIEYIKDHNENTRLTGIYNIAKRIMESASNEESFKRAASEFEMAAGFEDADELKQQCLEKAEICNKERLAKVEAERLEAKRKAEERRIAVEKAAKKRKKAFAIGSPIVAACIAFVIVLTTVIIPNIKYNAAVSLMKDKKYEEAIMAFEALDGYRDSADKIISTWYLLASSQLENKEYQKAYENFSLIKEYKDSKEKFQTAGIGYAQSEFDSKKYQAAIDILDKLEDSDQKRKLLDQCYLSGAKEFYGNKEYYSALTWYQMVTGYDKNAALYTDSCYNYAVECIGKGAYTPAFYYLDKSGNHSGVEEQRNAAKYGYVIANKDNKNTTTYQYLKELKAANYKDSADIYKNLYAWKVTVIAINSDPDDKTTNKSSISVYDPVIFHYKLTGGEPNGKLTIKEKITFPNGESKNVKDNWVAYNGSTGWRGWTSGLYENPEYGTRGTLSMTFYDDNGNTIGSGSVRITS